MSSGGAELRNLLFTPLLGYDIGRRNMGKVL